MAEDDEDLEQELQELVSKLKELMASRQARIEQLRKETNIK